MERIKLTFKKCDFVVNESKNVVTAIITAQFDKYLKNTSIYLGEEIKAVGIARCYRDNFDETTGKRIARAKAERNAYIEARNILRNEIRNINKDISSLNTSIDFFSDCIDHQDDFINEF